MPDAIRRYILICLCAGGLAACNSEPATNQDILIDTNVPADAEFETLPPDEGSGTPAEELDNESATTPDTRTPEESGDGDDMVNIIDDTSSNRNGR